MKKFTTPIHKSLPIFLFSFLISLSTVQCANAQCSTAVAPSYSSSCSSDWYKSLSAAGVGVTSTIAAGLPACTVTYYNDYATQGITASLGNTVTVSMTRATGYTAYLSVYIDWNNNGVYDPTELCGSMMTLSSGVSSASYVFTVPTVGVVTGVNLHMRVFLSEISGGAPCTATYGQTYDFYCNIGCVVPLSITGPSSVCAGSSVTLSDATTGGTWASSNTSVATIGTSSGVVSGVTAGTTTITYSTGSTCTTTMTLTVNPAPTAIIGPFTVCAGSMITLSDATTGGTWTSGTTPVATINPSTGDLSGVVAGTSKITYTLGTGCSVTAVVTVNPTPTVIFGPASVCAGSSITLSDGLGGGSWTSSTTAVATIGSGSGLLSGVVPGTTTITYTTGAGCYVTTTVTVNPVPSPITGPSNVCVGSTITLSDIYSGGTWTSSNTIVATINPVSGLLFGASAGTSTITYANSFGCSVTKTITVNPLPTVIIGPGTVCAGSSIVLTDGITGGTWTSSTTTVATIGLGSGAVNGVSAGTTTITYSTGFGCSITKAITVNPTPAALTGPSNVCVGSTITLSDPSPGGTWTSSNTSVATINPGSGVLLGISPGTSLISYANGFGCAATATITVNLVPTVILGPAKVCAGSFIVLSDATLGGSWTSSNTTVATIGLGSGVLNGVASGTATITYTTGFGCSITTSVTVNAIPMPITGPTNVCVGFSIALSDATLGCTWTSSNTTVATITPLSGVLLGLSAGTSIISYTNSNGCYVTQTVTVNPVPLAISGPAKVCVGSTITLSDAGGGTWSSSNTSVATVGSGSGVVSGVFAGTATITYTLAAGCTATVTITVNPVPASIIGSTYTCTGATVTLSDGGGGKWSSSNTAVATIGSGTGVASALAVGTSVISYTFPTGCYAIVTLTVSASPPAISGTPYVCIGSSTPLSDAGGGTWTSSNTVVAAIGLTTGVLSGVAIGTSSITYSLGSGCTAITTITVNPLPSAISGTTVVCTGATTALTDAGGGTWTSSNTTVATVGLGTGVVTGVAGGSCTITYTLPTGCTATTTVTVNPSPSGLLGSSYLCVGASTLLVGPGGGSWSSSNTSVVTIGLMSGFVSGVSAGTSIITYALLTTGCYTTLTETVYPLPSAISGVTSVCVGSTATLSDAGFGQWASDNTTIATIGSTSGVVTGMSPGTTVITYSLSSGCFTTTSLTVNPLPATISGLLGVCSGGASSLSDTSPGGTWSSDNTTVATIGSTSGIVTASSAGTATISYTLGTGCTTTAIFYVNPAPPPITGSGVVCMGSTTTLTDPASGGAWSSSNTVAAIITGSSGIVSGMSAGTSTIVYSLGFGCFSSTVVTVYPVSPITGYTSVCVGFTSTLSDAIGGGTWTSGTTTIATVGKTSGVVAGIAIGTSVITYTTTSGCSVSLVFTVNPLPPGITGIASMCAGSSITLSDSFIGGTWGSLNTGIAVAGSTTGIVTGINAGTTTITYSIGSGCSVGKTVTVLQLPTPIVGSTNICFGSVSPLTDGITGGIWTSSNTAIAAIGSVSGLVTPVSVGPANVIYTLPDGCARSVPVVIEPLPAIYTVMGGGHYCAGTPGTDISLNGSSVGTNYFLFEGGVATGPVSGTGSAIDFGLQTTAGFYSVIATILATGCTGTMTGTADVYIDTSVIPSVTLTGTSDTVCSGTLVNFTTLVKNGGSSPVYAWFVNGFAVGLSAAYSYVPANGDVITCRLVSNARCALPDTVFGSMAMKVIAPQMPSATISSDTVCQGHRATIVPVTLYPGSAPVFTWFINKVNHGSGSTFTYIPSNGDVVYCNMTSNYPCSSAKIVASNSVVMTVDSPLIPRVEIKATPGLNIGIGWTDTLIAQVTNGGASPTYQWVINGVPVVGSTSNMFVSSKFRYPTPDSVSCEVTSSGICSSTTYNWAYINVSRVYVNPANANSDNRFTVLPNPNKGAFVIKGQLAPGDVDATLEITDLLGHEVYRNSLSTVNGIVDQQVTLGSSVANGMYILSIRSQFTSEVYHIVVEQ